jgi:hypothetical protein
MDAGNEAYRIGAEMDPNNGPLHENLLGCFNHTTRWSAADSKAAHVAWAKRFAEPEIEIPSYTNDRSPEKSSVSDTSRRICGRIRSPISSSRSCESGIEMPLT